MSVDFWEEEFRIYKTFDQGGRHLPRYHKLINYNERPLKLKDMRKGCPCGGPHWEDCTKKSKARRLYYRVLSNIVPDINFIHWFRHKKEIYKSRIYKVKTSF